MTVTGDDVVDRLRGRIVEFDELLLEVVNARLETVTALLRHKVANELPLVDPGREAWLLEHLARVNEGPLSREGAERLCRFVLELTKDETFA